MTVSRDRCFTEPEKESGTLSGGGTVWGIKPRVALPWGVGEGAAWAEAEPACRQGLVPLGSRWGPKGVELWQVLRTGAVRCEPSEMVWNRVSKWNRFVSLSPETVTGSPMCPLESTCLAH